MKIYLFIIGLCLLSISTFSQSLQGTVTYRQVIVNDTIKNFESIKESTLFFDVKEAKSVYINDRKKNDSPERKIERKADGSVYVSGNKGSDKLGKILFKSLKTKELIYREFISKKPFIVKDSCPQIQWSILDDSKIIGDLLCQKAIGNYRGRTYTAWFTLKIPISDGPWKLCGLPGLILEAADEKNHIRFEFQSIEFPKTFDEVIIAPKDGEDINFLGYYKLKEQSDEDAPKRIKALAEQSGATLENFKISFNNIERNIKQ
jgi:GLPGLI family protein